MAKQKTVAERDIEYSVSRVWPFVLLLFALSLAIRLIGLRWGLPSVERWYSYHPDERQMVAAVLSLDFFAADFNPNFFNYPSLFIYLAYLAHFFAGGFGLNHEITPANQMWAFSHDVILSARFVCAFLGAATVPLVFLIARQIASFKTALLAALLLAFCPGHVQHSHFATVDVAATFFVTLSPFLATCALRLEHNRHELSQDEIARRQRKILLWSAFASGLAAATKYNGAIAIVAPLAALWLLHKARDNPNERVLNNAPLLLLAAAAGFIIGCPYSVLGFREFWGSGVNGFAYEMFVHSRQGSGEVFQNTGNGWIYHLTFNLPFTLTAPLVCLAVFGVIWLIWRRTSKYSGLSAPLLAFTVIYFLALGFSQVRYMRYVLPLTPALCVFAALFVWELQSYFAEQNARVGRTVGTLTAAALSLLMLAGSLDVLRPLVRIDPRDVAASWLKTYAANANIALASDRPWFWSVPLSPQDAPPGANISVEDALARANETGSNYTLSTLNFDAQELLRQKPQYVVMSELEWRDKVRLRDAGYETFVAQLNARYGLQHEFMGAPSLLPGRTFVPHDFLYTNPQVHIYRLKSAR